MEIASRSGAMCSPDFPTAMTMRPQFASSPAIAVLTSGELATASAVRRAAGSSTAPRTSMVTNFEMPSPSFTTCCARSSITLSSAARNDRTSGLGGIGDWRVAGGAGREHQRGVVGRGVRVDGDAVEGSLGGGCEQRLKGRWRDNGVGEHEGQHRRHIRSNPSPLPSDDTGYLNGNVVDDCRRGAALRKRIGRRDRAGCLLPIRLSQILYRAGQSCDQLIGRQELADDPGGRNEHPFGQAAQQAADGGGSVGRGLLAGGPGEGIGVACVDDQRLARPPASTCDTTVPARLPFAIA